MIILQVTAGKPFIATVLSKPPISGDFEMASSEKQKLTFPLDVIPPKHERTGESSTTGTVGDLVPVKFPTRPRRKVVVIIVVFAAAIVVIVAAALIGKYVPEMSDTDKKCK